MNIDKAMTAYCARNMARPFGDQVAQKYKSVYLPFQTSGLLAPAIGKALYFNSDTQLDGRNAVLKGIELLDSVSASRFQSGIYQRDNIAPTSAHNGSLVISNEQREVIATLPLYNLVRRLNDGKLTFLNIDSHLWQNCYVEFTNLTGISAAIGLQFIVYFDTK